MFSDKLWAQDLRKVTLCYLDCIYNEHGYISLEDICEYTTNYKGLVLKFQVQHALKAAGQWELITGTANIKAEDYEIKKQKGLLFRVTVHGAEIHANSYELPNPTICGMHYANPLNRRQ